MKRFKLSLVTLCLLVPLTVRADDGVIYPYIVPPPPLTESASIDLLNLLLSLLPRP